MDQQYLKNDAGPLQGVVIRELTPYSDARGRLVELTHADWYSEAGAGQWNALSTNAGVLRGMQVHVRRNDYIVSLQGSMTAGLFDLRRNSPTWKHSMMLSLSGDRPQMVSIPPGIAHGFYYHETGLTLQMLSERYDPEDEFHILWSDELLNMPWPADIQNPVLSMLDTKPVDVRDISRFSPLLAI